MKGELPFVRRRSFVDSISVVVVVVVADFKVNGKNRDEESKKK